MKQLLFSAPLSAEPANSVTPQKHRREARLQSIIDEAKRVLSRQGYADFTLRKVAAEAGVPLGTLQHYFPTRELLLSTVISQTIRTYNEGYERLASGSGTPEQRLQAIIDRVLAEIDEDDVRPFFLEITALATHEPFAAEALSESHRSYLGTFCRLIAEINPALSQADCELRALLIASQLEGLMMFRQDSHSAAKPERNALLRAVKLVALSLSNAP
ncbi:hypothetical protein GCM10027082_05720 [Comamonas humi]